MGRRGELRVRTGCWAYCLIYLAQERPVQAAVVGVGQSDAEVGVGACGGVFVVVAVGDDETA